MLIVCPVMKPFSASKITTPTISSTSPKRPTGICRNQNAEQFSRANNCQEEKFQILPNNIIFKRSRNDSQATFAFSKSVEIVKDFQFSKSF